MNLNPLVILTVGLTIAGNALAELQYDTNKVERIYDSADFRERIGDLQDEGYVVIKLDDLMDRSKYTIDPRATENVHVVLSVNPSYSAQTFELLHQITLFDAKGAAHQQELRILQTNANRWEWTIGANKGPLDLTRETTARIAVGPRGLSVTIHFEPSLIKAGRNEITRVTQDGYTRGTFAGWTAGPDSNHREVIYSNGETRIIEFRKQ